MDELQTMLDPNTPEGHATYGHSNVLGHYCIEWDFLYICKDCPEFECCTCFPLLKDNKNDNNTNESIGS
jgi:hypothetical protein